MKKFLAVLLSIATIVVIVFAALDQREGLWHCKQQCTVEKQNTVEDSININVNDTLQSNSISVEIEPLTDTTIIDL